MEPPKKWYSKSLLWANWVLLASIAAYVLLYPPESLVQSCLSAGPSSIGSCYPPSGMWFLLGWFLYAGAMAGVVAIAYFDGVLPARKQALAWPRIRSRLVEEKENP